MEFLIIGILTLLNWFFALSEIALVSVKKSKIQHLASKKDNRAKIILKLLENPENFLSSVQVGITLVSIVSGAYGWYAIASTLAPYFEGIPFLGDHAEGTALAVAIWGITYFSIVIGELVPKTIALNNPEWFALFCVPILRYFMMLTYPFVKLLSFSTMIILKVLWIQDIAEEKLSEEELISLLKNAWKQGILDKDESKIHNNVFSFWDQTAKSMITHRNKVEWVDINDSQEAIFKKIQDSVHSKFIVADSSLDNVIWILKIRSFLESQNTANFSLKQIISEPIIFPENTSAIQILNTFKRKKEYMAIVVDEFGGTEWIITLHDLMEVIVGNLPDEDEEVEWNIVKGSLGEYLIGGRTLIYEINQYFQENVIEDSSSEYTTLSWYIMNEFGRLPKTWEKIQNENGYQFEVVDMDWVKIDKIIMTKIIEKETEE
jgi:putative hemolysin